MHLCMFTCCRSPIFQSLCNWSPAYGTPAPVRAQALMYIVSIFPLLWMMHGQTLHSLSRNCQATSPFLYFFFNWFARLAITLHTMYLSWLGLSIAGVPFLLFLVRRTPLNPVLVWMAERGLLQTPAAAHPNSINEMDIVEYKPDMFADPENPSDPRPQGECCICLEAYEATKQIRRTPCGHLMHHGCLALWLQSAHTCPTCRHDLDISESAQSAWDHV